MDDTLNMDADPTANISNSEVLIPDHSVSHSASAEEFPESHPHEPSGDDHDAPESKEIEGLEDLQAEEFPESIPREPSGDDHDASESKEIEGLEDLQAEEFPESIPREPSGDDHDAPESKEIEGLEDLQADADEENPSQQSIGVTPTLALQKPQ
eukprot:gene5303-3785_t